ncbi:porin family protein [Sulfurovum sp.]|uniref:porin family protein n=1 Tax=Sulfurovum sp. TaxID=1969726 RepID=UPI0026001D9D|nr:porin family protein [Sulfurovum sp.]
MKKQLLAAALAAQLMTQLYAGGDIEKAEPAEVEGSNFYIVAKGLLIRGDEITEEEETRNGDTGYGFGVDFGYRIGKGFALEYDFSYSKNTMTAKKEGFEPEAFDVQYYTSAIDFVYVYEATETVGLFAKIGYEYEWENIDELDEKNTDHGAVVGAGMEIAINEDYKLITEYEHSTIKGPRGDSIYAGMMFNF